MDFELYSGTTDQTHLALWNFSAVRHVFIHPIFSKFFFVKPYDPFYGLFSSFFSLLELE